MSFGRPPSINVGFKPSAPDRGSFPLDHFGLNFDPKEFSSLGNKFYPGECKRKMELYMACLKENSSTSTPCRDLSRDYLDCRMNK
jgi:cytochrome c oxidase assembly protein subunit 19